jgi:N-acetylglucosamine malate deacetylase 2
MPEPAPLVERLRLAPGRKRLLAVWAHPDDESFGPVATFRRAADAGVATALLTATRGEAGEIRLPGVRREELGAVRERELLAAAGAIGFEQVCLLDYVDGELEQHFELHRAVAEAIRSFQPHVVVTFGPDGVTGHPDHLAIGAATTLAFGRTQVPVGGDGPWKLYYHVPPPGAEVPELAPHAPPLPPTARVQASELRQAKLDALACHRTQTAGSDLPGEHGDEWLTTDYFFRVFPPVFPDDPAEDDLLAGV